MKNYVLCFKHIVIKCTLKQQVNAITPITQKNTLHIGQWLTWLLVAGMASHKLSSNEPWCQCNHNDHSNVHKWCSYLQRPAVCWQFNHHRQSQLL